jgi:hypothetical protein
MISPIKNRLLFLPALLLSLPLALAQAPSGLVWFPFGPTASPVWDFTGAYLYGQEQYTAAAYTAFPVWDFTGAYQFTDQMVEADGALLALSFQVFITHDLAGRLSGSGTTMVTIGQDVVAGNYVLKGAVSGGGSATRATFTVTLAGDGLDVIAGEPRSYHISLTYNLRVDPDLLAWVVEPNAVRGSVHISGLGSASVTGGGFTVPLPHNVDGRWSVYMDIVPLNRLEGSAMIVIDSSAPLDQAAYLPDTLTLNAGLAGTYKPTQGSQVRLTGLPGSRPATLHLTLNGQAQLVKIAGKILGQTVSYTTPSADP